jgi:anti-sigma factor RsiW
MKSDCDNLDAYLANDLPAGAATHFVQHLNECSACHEAVAQQRWIDNLLHSNEFASIEPLPAGLRETLRRSNTKSRQTTHLIACGLAAAATIAIVAVGWTLKLNRQAAVFRASTATQTTAQVNPLNPNSSNSASRRATFVSNGDTIAVPLESGDDEVTIVQLYPTTETERRTRRELALQFIYSESNGG